MRWEWISFDRRTITIQNSEGFTTKSKRSRVGPLADEAYTVILGRRERAQDGTSRVFDGLRMTPGHVTFKVKENENCGSCPLADQTASVRFDWHHLSR